MHTTRTVPLRPQEQAPSVGTPGRPTSPGRRLGWLQQLQQWGAGRRLERLRRLDDLWDAQHERVQVQATEDRLDYITRTTPRLGLEIYGTLS